MADEQLPVKYGKRKVSEERYAQQTRKKQATVGGRTYGSRKRNGPAGTGGKPGFTVEPHVFVPRSPLGALRDMASVETMLTDNDELRAENARLRALFAAGSEAQLGTTIQQDDPFVERSQPGALDDGRVSVAEVRALLERDPSMLDHAIRVEFEGAKPRRDAVRAFLRLERASPEPRTDVLEMLEPFAG